MSDLSMDPIDFIGLDASESISVLTALRQCIVEGRYSAGERLTEMAVSQALGVSRTPVRLAFRTLAQEGLLQVAGKRGYLVREFSEVDVAYAVEVRGALEGLAARHLAERGMDTSVRQRLLDCLLAGEQVVGADHLGDDGIGAWSRLNATFHGTIVQAVGSSVIADAIARNNHLPFASADSIVIDREALGRELDKLRIAQLQHRLVFDALERRESARVEALMREHAQVGLRYGCLLDARQRG
jgi:GntR family transcriptional regulator, vanillate catabolism transcriptional regulator